MRCCISLLFVLLFFFFKQKTAYELRISDWSSDVCSSDLDKSARRKPGRKTQPIGEIALAFARDERINSKHETVVTARMRSCHELRGQSAIFENVDLEQFRTRQSFGKRLDCRRSQCGKTIRQSSRSCRSRHRDFRLLVK